MNLKSSSHMDCISTKSTCPRLLKSLLRSGLTTRPLLAIFLFFSWHSSHRIGSVIACLFLISFSMSPHCTCSITSNLKKKYVFFNQISLYVPYKSSYSFKTSRKKNPFTFVELDSCWASLEVSFCSRLYGWKIIRKYSYYCQKR